MFQERDSSMTDNWADEMSVDGVVNTTVIGIYSISMILPKGLP